MSKKTEFVSQIPEEIRGNFSLAHFDRPTRHTDTAIQPYSSPSSIAIEQKNSPPKLAKRSFSTMKSVVVRLSSTRQIKRRVKTHDTEPTVPFDATKVRRLIREELEKLKSASYRLDGATCVQVSNRVRYLVKSLGFPRYRYVVMVTTVQDGGQGVTMATRFFWDEKRDDFVSENVKVGDVYLMVNVYAIYLE